MINKARVGLAGDPDSSWRLIADIGGTHARFALADDYGALQSHETLECEAFDGPAEAARAYLSRQNVNSIRAAAFAVATAVYTDHIAFTNRASWSFSIRELGNQLGVQQFRVINDFTALALSIPRLDREWLVPVSGHGTRDFDAPLAVIGPGTGLGVSGVIPTRHGWQALAGEGGHTTLAPATEREVELLAILTRRFGHVSSERVLSGPGLSNLYQANCELSGLPPEDLKPADITERALSGECDICTTVVDDFFAMLGTATANLVLTLGARGGAYIGGGIVPRLADRIGHSRFRERFEEHGRLTDYLKDVPCYIVTAEYPALQGALASLSSA
ncbi:glucokinase [Salinisphaera sp. Q1T1-3]|uniref:glucokinase n=1 Tax=Salinisphaera sp. Q1T1-3 TaxID=2321229 RepID=UPI000E730A27|nr:glucokinase [Salinisphaera sp. Q1T1-3]RJS93097.1 glucokinase [Salinisphaera sp. Q1T1-3]